MTELTWRKSSRSGQSGDCVEVAMTPQATHVRDSKHRAGGTLALNSAQWQAFLHGLKLKADPDA